MPIRTTLLAVMVLGAMASGAHATEPRTIFWNDLRPPLPDIESPFSDLSPKQLEDMRMHVRWVTSAPADKEEEAFRQEAEDALARLTAGGVDVEDLMAQRRELIIQTSRTARGPNPEVLGARVRVPGYMLPISFDGQKVTEFMLVPTVGACIHTPPPPPNQIIHVKFPAGYEISRLFEAVWVDGKLDATSMNHQVGYSDGSATVQTSYTLDAGAIEAYLE